MKRTRTTKTRNILLSRLLSLLLVMAMCIGLLPKMGGSMTALAAETVTLYLTNGAITIDYDGYTQNGATVAFTGDYIITGSITADTPLDLINTSNVAVTYNITLDNASLVSQTNATAVRINSDNVSDITLNLTSRGVSKISAYSFPAIQNNSDKTLTVNLSVLYGFLTMENRYSSGYCLITNGTNNILNVADCTKTSDGTEVSNTVNTTFVTTHIYTDNGDGTHSFAGCSSCGAEAVSNEVHDNYYINNYDDTHTVTCSGCGSAYTDEHSYEYTDNGDGTHSGVCTLCRSVSSAKHTVGEVTVTTEPTETEYGEGSYTCSLCGADDTLLIAPTGRYWIRLSDSFGDGWNGASLSVYVNGVETIITMDDGNYQDFLIEATVNDVIVVMFHKGEYDGECGVEIYAPVTYTPLYSITGMREIANQEVIYAQNVADYSDVDAAITAVPADLTVYTIESLRGLFTAIDAIVYYLPTGDQDKVDGYANDILEAIDALDLIDEDYEIESLELTLSDTNNRLIITSTGYRWGEDGTETSYTGAYSLTTDGAEIEASVLVESGVHVITIDDMSLYSEDYSPFAVSSGSVVFLTLEGNNTLYADSYGYAGLNAPTGAYLYISGEGSLEAKSYDDGAGIGGNYGEGAGNITIYSGTITAVSGTDGAGIGGGDAGNAGNITIYGGTITSVIEQDKEGDGAGIGCGENGFGGTILIYGGTIIAYADDEGAGIGGAEDGYPDYILIAGGTITASGAYGAGIGGGEDSECVVEITGGFITVSSNYSTAIGGGSGEESGKITITGGVIVIEGYDTNIIGADDDLKEDSNNYVIIDGGYIFLSDSLSSSDYDAIEPAPKNQDGELVYHQSYTSTRDDGYAAATLSDESVVLAYVLNGRMSLYLPDGVTIVSEDDPDADYSAVTAALALVPTDRSVYTEDSLENLDDAIDAIVYGLYFDKQEEVNAMADAITDAIDALVYLDADYSAVDEAIAAVPVDLTFYTDETVEALNNAINAVVEGKNITEQTDVNGMAEAITDAIDALVYKDADYTAVNSAIAAASALDADEYKNFTEVEAAIAAVVEGKNITEQIDVNGMAEAITDAIDALVYKDADYTAVNNAIAAANALNADEYKDFTEVEAAIAAVVEGKNITEQLEVNAMVAAIETAIVALIYKDADYIAVNSAIEAARALNADEYVDFSGVETAIAAVVEDKNITEQAEVDAMAAAIEAAIAALVYKNADYSAVEAAVASVPADLTVYTDESVQALETAIAAVVEGKNITEQAEVDAMEKTIEAAITALVYKNADYSAVEAAVASVPADLTVYTDESVQALETAIAAVAEGKNITEQTEVDEMVTVIETAITALVYKDADYSAVEAAVASVPADLTVYTDESVQALQDAIAAVSEDKNITEQTDVDAMAATIEAAVIALAYKSADYSAVEAAIAEAEDLDADDYTDFSAVEAAMAAVVEGKNITEQAEVDAMAEAIFTAINELEYIETTEEPSEEESEEPSEEESEEPSEEESEEPTEEPSEEVVLVSPKTGDADFLIFIIALVMAAGACAVAFRLSRHRNLFG